MEQELQIVPQGAKMAVVGGWGDGHTLQPGPEAGVYVHNLVCVHVCASYAHACGGMYDITMPLIALLFASDGVSH